MKNSDKKLPLSAILLAIFCNTVFGSAVPVIKLGCTYFGITDGAFDKMLYAGIRFFISGVLVFFLSMIINKRLPLPKKSNALNVVAVALTYTFLQYLFLYIGFSKVAGTISSVLSATSVFMAVVLAHFIYPDDRLNLKKGVGSIIGFIGVLLASVSGISSAVPTLFGEGFIIIGTAFFVIGSFFVKRATRIDNSFTVTAYNLLIGGGLLSVVGLIGGGSFTVTAEGIIALSYLIFVSSVGFSLWSVLLKKYPVGKISVYSFIIPVSGSVFSAILLGDNLFSPTFFFALILVCIGIYTVNSDKIKK